jgi:DNA-binding transcriptional regulator YhcF (GntR family)
MDPNPDDPRALYRRVLDDIRAQIRDGRLTRGMRLPSAKELTAHYGVAQMTVQRALQELKHDGLIFSVQGKGTYVHPGATFRLEQAADTTREPVVIDDELKYYAYRDRLIQRIDAGILDIELAAEQGGRKGEAQAKREFFDQLAAMVPDINDLVRYERSYPDREVLAKHEILRLRPYPGNLAQDGIDGKRMTEEQIDAYYAEQEAAEAGKQPQGKPDGATRKTKSKQQSG